MIKITTCVILVIVYSGSVYCAPILNGLEYLIRYGYLVKPDPRRGTLLDEKDVIPALKLLQRMAGIKETGKLDRETLSLMEKDRCGMADFSRTDNVRRKKRYKRYGTKWYKGNLTWYLGNSNNDEIPDKKVREVMRQAFKKWSDITNLDFKEDSKRPDIRVRFEMGQHKDVFAFDGPGGVLAHAFYPSTDLNDELAGDVHFDDAERYTVDSPTGRNLLWVAVHELGHSIGLDHSTVKGAVMFPWYQSTQGKDFDLTPDDIKGAQSIYGSRSQSDKTFASGTQAPMTPKFCLTKIKSGFTATDGRTYIINGAKSYIFDPFLLPEKGPMLTSKLFQGLNTIDAVFQRQWDGKIVALSGDRYYIYKDYIKVRSGTIDSGFLGLPKNISNMKSAFVWPGNDKLYLFRGSQYWRFSTYPITGMYQVDLGYPRLIKKAWKGIPENFDAVFAWSNRKTYFFKDNKYYRLNDRYLRVENGYPRSITADWSKCAASIRAVDSGNKGLTDHFMPIVLAFVLLISTLTVV